MCLAVPMKIKKIKGNIGLLETEGVERKVDISLLKSLKEGDYVIVHAGFAIERLDPDYAKEVQNLWNELESI